MRVIAMMALVVWAITGNCSRADAEPPVRSVPLIHCTDVFYPPDDPDDYFDLAAVYAVPEFDIRAVVLDQGEKQKDRPGSIAVAQLNRITGRKVPCTVGLSQKLSSPADKALDQPATPRSGIDSILAILRETTSPVAISVVGSARDVTAAFNREPELFRSKVSQLYVFCGDASHPTFMEWNVTMDPHAFVGLMRSGLPIVWMPCFDGGDWANKGNATFWKTTHRKLLDGAPEPLLQYFIAAMYQVTSHPLELIREPVKPGNREKLMSGERNMWGGALLALMAGRQIQKQGSGFGAVTPANGAVGSMQPYASPLFHFEQVKAGFADSGRVDYTRSDAALVTRIRVTDLPAYGEAMTSATARLLAGFPVAMD